MSTNNNAACAKIYLWQLREAQSELPLRQKRAHFYLNMFLDYIVNV